MIMDFVQVPIFTTNIQNIASLDNPNTSTPNTLTKDYPNPTRKPSIRKSSRYENQKLRDWNTFCHYIKSHCPTLPHFNPCHVLEFLRYLDQFGKTKVHNPSCPFFGVQTPARICPCPLRQAWGSLDALIGRLRAAYEKNGGRPENNPFGARVVRVFLREVRDFQAKARGISYDKKRKRQGGMKDKNIVVSNSE